MIIIGLILIAMAAIDMRKVVEVIILFFINNKVKIKDIPLKPFFNMLYQFIGDILVITFIIWCLFSHYN